MRRILMIVGFILVLIAVVIGGFYVMTGSALPFLKHDEAKALDKPSKPPAPVVTKFFYYQLNNVMLPAYRNGRFSNYIVFNLQLAMADKDDAKGDGAKEAQMRDALNREFSRKPIKVKGGPTDFDEKSVKARLLTRLRKAIGDDTLKNVLIASAISINP